jgi:hypothetical protein
MMTLYQNIFIFLQNVKDSHSWTKLHKTQSEAKFELEPFLFLLKKGREAIES